MIQEFMLGWMYFFPVQLQFQEHNLLEKSLKRAIREVDEGSNYNYVKHTILMRGGLAVLMFRVKWMNS